MGPLHFFLFSHVLFIVLFAPGAASSELNCAQKFEQAFSIHSQDLIYDLTSRMQKGDLKAWDSWWKVAAEEGLGLEEAQKAMALVSGQSKEVQGHMLSQIRENYTKLGKSKKKRYTPRASADLMVSAIVRPERIFADSMEKFKDPELALRTYFQTMRQTLPTHQGALNVNEVKEIVLLIQKELRRSRHRPGFSPEIKIMGSTPNGLALDGTSDLDLLIREDTKYALSPIELIGKVNQLLKSRFNRQGLDSVQTINSDDHSNPTSLTLPKAVQFLIAKDRVEIHVYPRPSPDSPVMQSKPVIYMWWNNR